MNVSSLPRVQPISAAVLASVPVFATAVAGSLATTPNIAGWYANLNKPWFNPPNWIFGPVWTVLFMMMAYAFYRVLVAEDRPLRTISIIVFLGHLVLNAGWSFAFFGAHSPFLGLVVVIALWCGVLASLLLFWKLDTVAGALLVPYLAWVSFAAVLNAAILALN